MGVACENAEGELEIPPWVHEVLHMADQEIVDVDE
jgi:hypothetical protein